MPAQRGFDVPHLRFGGPWGPAGATSPGEPGQSIPLEPTEPVLDGTGGGSPKMAAFHGTHALCHEEGTMEQVVVAKVVRPSVLVLDMYDHTLGVTGRDAWNPMGPTYLHHVSRSVPIELSTHTTRVALGGPNRWKMVIAPNPTNSTQPSPIETRCRSIRRIALTAAEFRDWGPLES